MSCVLLVQSCTRSQEGPKPRQLTQTGQKLFHIMECHVQYINRGCWELAELLLRDRRRIRWWAIDLDITCLGFYSSPFLLSLVSLLLYWNNNNNNLLLLIWLFFIDMIFISVIKLFLSHPMSFTHFSPSQPCGRVVSEQAAV